MIAIVTLIALAVGFTSAVPIESFSQHSASTTGKPASNLIETPKVLARRQLDISGGSVEYDNSDLSVIALSSDGDKVAVYEIVPRDVFDREISAQYSNLLKNEALAVDEQDDDDMAVAETHIFRPLFRYRANQDDRRRRRFEYDY